MMRDRIVQSEWGASFAEVLVAMAITMTGLAGAMGAFEAAERIVQNGMLATRALAMAESRIEAKRSASWERLLLDDVNHDGVPDLVMRDDGVGGDAVAGDGTYSGSWEQDGIKLIWTVTPSHSGSLPVSGHAVIEARAAYTSGSGPREVRIGTVLANLLFVESQ